MSSPAKRPAVTYQRGRKQATQSTLNYLNPDAILQQKINDLMFSREKENESINERSIEEFDSAYHEVSGNAKKVHDLVQVGETRRFSDEIEYIMQGFFTPIQSTSKLSIDNIKGSLDEILCNCFKDNGDGFGFGMKLKSHGVLGTIFDALVSYKVPKIQSDLIILIATLLHDVRRLDFFFKAEMAIDLAHFCITNDCEFKWNNKDLERLKITPVFCKLDTSDWSASKLTSYIGIWILSKWSFSCATTSSTDNSSLGFFELLFKDTKMMEKIIELTVPVQETFNDEEIETKAASLLDSLLNRGNEIFTNDSLKESLEKMIPKLIALKSSNVSFIKLAVSLTGSQIGSNFLSLTTLKNNNNFVNVVNDLVSLSFPFKDEMEVMRLSCLINLIDRCDDEIMDEFRFKCLEYTANSMISHISLLQYLSKQFASESINSELVELKNIHRSLHALVLGFILRKNRTNLEVMRQSFNSTSQEKQIDHYQEEILLLVTNFTDQLRNNNSKKCLVDVEQELIVTRLNEIIVTLKKN